MHQHRLLTALEISRCASRDLFHLLYVDITLQRTYNVHTHHITN
ncbi:hypothetical protein PITC_054970 [Penicillium italicum]|uniref:Uncharacterized protein n=1 Tax=Penicillium italicum TaxID=40296 RepID=A0A0A2K8A8_PENIT|nr:hypothetical protein PITC_054970 [Penicillium italicum]